MPLRRRLYVSSPDPFTPTPFVPDPPEWTQVGLDLFDRTESNGWGTADVGGAWTIETGTASTFSVASSNGQVEFAAAASQRAMKLGTLSFRDVRFLWRWRFNKIPAGGFVTSGVGVRGSGGYDGTLYRLRCVEEDDGSVRMQVYSIVAGVATTLDDVDTGIVLATAQDINARCEVVGASPTTLRMRAWLATASEPDTWPLDIEDSTAGLQDAGNLFIRSSVGSGVTNVPIISRLANIRVDEQDA